MLRIGIQDHAANTLVKGLAVNVFSAINNAFKVVRMACLRRMPAIDGQEGQSIELLTSLSAPLRPSSSCLYIDGEMNGRG